MCMCGLFGFFYSAPTTNLNSNTTQTTRQSLACWDPIQGACSVEDEHIQFKQQSPDAQMHNRLSNVTWLGSHRVASPQLLFEYWRWCGECSVTDTEASEEICYCRKTWLWPFPITKLLPPPPPPRLTLHSFKNCEAPETWGKIHTAQVILPVCAAVQSVINTLAGQWLLE